MTIPLRSGARRAQAGFSLIELGIVIAVIAVLALTVILSKGYLTAAKKKATVDLINSIRIAAEQFAQRHNNGVTFASIDMSSNLSMQQLQTDCVAGQCASYLPQNFTTPWNDPPSLVDIKPADVGECASVGGTGGAACSKCAGYSCMLIDMPVRDDAACTDLVNDLSNSSINVQCTGQHIKVCTR